MRMKPDELAPHSYLPHPTNGKTIGLTCISPSTSLVFSSSFYPTARQSRLPQPAGRCLKMSPSVVTVQIYASCFLFLKKWSLDDVS
ncbi:hypothetical protein TNCV_1870371 [Trichonephila clavipes]|nr:hypothetical protein TNCV_1870371 [Trichonephila clavipes]